MNKFEYFACGEFFACFPENKSFEFIVELCKNEDLLDQYNEDLDKQENFDDQLHLCAEYEDFWWSTIADKLLDLKERVERHFGDKQP